jgi:hypothetical protein
MDDTVIVTSLLRALNDEQGVPASVPYAGSSNVFDRCRACVFLCVCHFVAALGLFFSHAPTFYLSPDCRYSLLRVWTDDFAANRRIGGGGFGEVYLGVVAIPDGVGPGGVGHELDDPACVGLAVKRLTAVRLQGQELAEWKQDALVCMV